MAGVLITNKRELLLFAAQSSEERGLTLGRQ